MTKEIIRKGGKKKFNLKYHIDVEGFVVDQFYGTLGAFLSGD